MSAYDADEGEPRRLGWAGWAAVAVMWVVLVAGIGWLAMSAGGAP